MNAGTLNAQSKVRDPVRPQFTHVREMMMPLEAEEGEEGDEVDSKGGEDEGDLEQEIAARRKPLSPSKREREIH